MHKIWLTNWNLKKERHKGEKFPLLIISIHTKVKPHFNTEGKKNILKQDTRKMQALFMKMRDDLFDKNKI